MKIAMCVGAVLAVIGMLINNPANAQMVPPPASSYTPAPLAMVIVAEKNIGHTTCVAYKHTGLPIYFVVKTNREDIFWQKLPEVQKCLFQVKTWIDNPVRYMDKMMLIPEYTSSIPPLSGKFGEVRCTKSDAENVRSTLTEFSFPYLMNQKEIKIYLDKTKLQDCLKNMTSTEMPASPDWSKNG